MYVLGIDIGTESLRTALIDLHGRQVSTARANYPTSFPHPGWAEHDPHDWWQAAVEAVPTCLRRAGVAPDQILAIGLDAFASTLVAADDQGRPLRPAILWMDTRASQEALDIEATGDDILRYGGGQESVEWMLPRLLWLKRHEPEVFDSSARIVEALDWFTHRLTGRWVLSMCQITDLWHYMPSRGGWPHSLLEALGLSDAPSKWPEDILAIGAPVGPITGQAARALQLRPGTPVACGGIDAHIGLLGLNALQPGQLGLILGSSSVQLALSSVPVFAAGVWGPFEDTILPGRWLLEAGQISTGSILRWYRDNMAPGWVHTQAEAQGRTPYAILDELADAVGPGSGGLSALDYWQGNRTPIRDPLARGALVGLTLWHRPAHIYRALLEAAAFGNRHVVETLKDAGLEIHEIVASGGGAQSGVWAQMHADVCGLPLRVMSGSDACLAGCGVAAAVCAGEYADLEVAARRMAGQARDVLPDEARSADYREPYRRYRDLYPALRSIMHDLSRGNAA
jgi:ribulokinase